MLIYIIGNIGSGKSYYRKKLCQELSQKDIPVLSIGIDEIREIQYKQHADILQKAEDATWIIVRDMLANNDKIIIFETTGLSSRFKLIYTEFPGLFLYCNTPIAKCERRIQQRESRCCTADWFIEVAWNNIVPLTDLVSTLPNLFEVKPGDDIPKQLIEEIITKKI